MSLFCSNVLLATQCQGFDRRQSIIVLVLGVVQGGAAIGLTCWILTSAYSKPLFAWLLVLAGVTFAVTCALEAAARLAQPTFDAFVQLDRATASLGALSLAMTFASGIFAALFLIPRRVDTILRVVLLTLMTVVAIAAVVSDVVATTSLTYVQAGSFAIVGVGDAASFVMPTMISILATLLFHVLVATSLLRSKRLSKTGAVDELYDRMPSTPINEKSNSNRRASSQVSIARTLFALQPPPVLIFSVSFFVSAARVSATFANPSSSVIPRRALLMLEYLGHVAVAVQWIRLQSDAEHEQKRGEGPTSVADRMTWKLQHSDGGLRKLFFTRRPPPTTTPQPQPQMSQDAPQLSTLRSTSDMIPAMMQRYLAGTDRSERRLAMEEVRELEDSFDEDGLAYSPPRSDASSFSERSGTSAMSKRFRRYSEDTGVSFASLEPDDSASIAAFLPRPPPPPLHLRQRTRFGPNGSELTPLRTSLLQRVELSAEYERALELQVGSGAGSQPFQLATRESALVYDQGHASVVRRSSLFSNQDSFEKVQHQPSNSNLTYPAPIRVNDSFPLTSVDPEEDHLNFNYTFK